MSGDLSRRQMLAIGAALPFAGSSLTRPTVPSTSAVLRPQAVSLPAGASSFVTVTPARLADTRPDQGVDGFTRIDARTIRVQITGRGAVPGNATAGVLNVTAVNTIAAGFITVYPAGTARPEASNVNVDFAGQIIPNLVTVRLGSGAGVGGAIDIFTQNPCDIVVDVNGAFTPVTDAVSAGRFVGLETAVRVLDTRDGGGKVVRGATTRVGVGQVVPASATAVVVNLTVTESNGAGFWAAFPAGGSIPQSSSLNTDGPNQTRANQAIVPIGVVGAISGLDVFASSGGHLIVDVAGYFTGASASPGTDGLFVPNAPYRTLDTRSNAVYGRMYPGWIAEFDYFGRNLSQAVVVNLTATETRGVGYFTGYPARTNRPLASNLNASYKNQTIANHAILRASSAGVAVYTQSGASLVVDVAGYFIGQPTAAVLPAPVNVIPPPPPPQPALLPYRLIMPRIGRIGTVLEGVGRNVVDAGYVGHWPGTGFAGEESHMLLFGHRTEHGGIFRQMHTFVPGDEVTIESADGRVFRYGYARRDITNSSAANIYNVGLAAALPSISIVGCTKTNYLPTDVRFRLVVTFSLLAEETA